MRSVSHAALILECIDRKGGWRNELARDEKKPQDLGWGFVRGSNGGAALTAGRIPHRTPLPIDTLISQKQSVAALEQFRCCPRAILSTTCHVASHIAEPFASLQTLT